MELWAAVGRVAIDQIYIRHHLIAWDFPNETVVKAGCRWNSMPFRVGAVQQCTDRLFIRFMISLWNSCAGHKESDGETDFLRGVFPPYFLLFTITIFSQHSAGSSWPFSSFKKLRHMSTHLFPQSPPARVFRHNSLLVTQPTTTSSLFDTRVCSAWLRRSKTAVKWIKRRADKRRLEEVEVRAHSENWTKSSVEKREFSFLID